MKIDLTVDFGPFDAEVDAYVGKAVEPAVAAGINAAAFPVKKALVAEATNVFDRTTPFTLRGFNVLPVVPGGRSDAAAGNAADLARRAVAAFRDFEADCIVAETNHDMVKAVLAQVDASVPVRTIHDVMAARERCKGFT